MNTTFDSMNIRLGEDLCPVNILHLGDYIVQSSVSNCCLIKQDDMLLLQSCSLLQRKLKLPQYFSYFVCITFLNKL